MSKFELCIVLNRAQNGSKSVITIFAKVCIQFSRNFFRKNIFCISRNFAKLATLLSTVKALIKAGARLDIRTNDDTNGVMPLHLAAQCGKADIVRFLVRSGAEVDAKDNQGNTPLRYMPLQIVLTISQL